MLKVEHLTKMFGGLAAVNDAAIDFDANQVNAIIGPIEHKVDMIMGIADKIMVLNHGEKIVEGTPDQIKNNSQVIEAYLGGWC